MNKLISDINGGFPFVLDDLRWEQKAVREAFKGLLSIFPDCKLSGCIAADNGSTYSCTEGYISLGGEVIYVPAQTVSAGADIEEYGWQISQTYDPSGLKVFEDAAAHDTYAIRQGEFAFVDGGSLPDTLASDSKSFKELLKEFILADQASAWISSTPSYSGFSTVGNNKLKYKIIGSVLHISFVANGTPSANGFTLNLPAGLNYNMDSRTRFIGYAASAGTNKQAVAINTNGSGLRVESLDAAGFDDTIVYEISGNVTLELN